jgi:hypothetical protein
VLVSRKPVHLVLALLSCDFGEDVHGLLHDVVPSFTLQRTFRLSTSSLLSAPSQVATASLLRGPAPLPVATISVAVAPRSQPSLLPPWDPDAHAASRVLDLLASGLGLDTGDEIVGQHLRCPSLFRLAPLPPRLSDIHKLMTKPE